MLKSTKKTVGCDGWLRLVNASIKRMCKQIREMLTHLYRYS